MANNIFKDLFVLDMANNHYGNINHAKNIVRLFSNVQKKHRIKATIKFQFRDLPNFVHKKYRDKDIKYVIRFLDTRLSVEGFLNLFKFIKKNNFLTSYTI